jgi:hypothetical protein
VIAFMVALCRVEMAKSSFAMYRPFARRTYCIAFHFVLRVVNESHIAVYA